jgi:hypothetical protein
VEPGHALLRHLRSIGIQKSKAILRWANQDHSSSIWLSVPTITIIQAIYCTREQREIQDALAYHKEEAPTGMDDDDDDDDVVDSSHIISFLAIFG